MHAGWKHKSLYCMVILWLSLFYLNILANFAMVMHYWTIYLFFIMSRLIACLSILLLHHTCSLSTMQHWADSSTCRLHAVAYLGGAMRPWKSPLGKSKNIFWRDTLLKMGFQTYIVCSKVPSKCKKCRFRDPNFKKFPRGHASGPT